MEEQVPLELTDAQWAVISPLLSDGKSGQGRVGRSRRDNRLVLQGILWLLPTGARWKDIPGEFPPYPSCHRRFGEWIRGGTLKHILPAIVADLQDRGGIDLSETFIDGSFSSAKKERWSWWDKARQGVQDHGNCGAPWFFCRTVGWKRFAT